MANLDKLQAHIDQIRDRVSSGTQLQFNELSENRLVAAEQSLLQARSNLIDGDHKKCEFQTRMADAVQLRIAIRHLEHTNSNSPDRFSGKAQEYIGLLSEGIIEFKTVIEWKNCQLRPGVRQWFVECVEMHEDALNFLRFGGKQSAEFAALGGLLLQAYICNAAEHEHQGQLSIAGKCDKVKLPKNADVIYGLIKRLSRLRRAGYLNLALLNEEQNQEFAQAHEEAETALIEVISAYGGDNGPTLRKTLLTLQTRIADIDRLMVEWRSTSKGAAATGEKKGSGRAREPEAFVLPTAFEKKANGLKHLLKDRVDDKEYLSLRILSVCQTYERSYRAYLAADRSRAWRLIDSAKSDIDKLELLFMQAQLFKKEE